MILLYSLPLNGRQLMQTNPATGHCCCWLLLLSRRPQYKRVTHSPWHSTYHSSSYKMAVLILSSQILCNCRAKNNKQFEYSATADVLQMEKKQTTRGIVRDERTTLNAQLRLLVSPMHQLGAQRGSLRSFSGKVLRSSKDVGGDEYNLRAHQFSFCSQILRFY